jgi:hypothetical protein
MIGIFLFLLFVANPLLKNINEKYKSDKIESYHTAQVLRLRKAIRDNDKTQVEAFFNNRIRHYKTTVGITQGTWDSDAVINYRKEILELINEK